MGHSVAWAAALGPSNLRLRLISAAVLIPLALLLVGAGGVLLLLGTVVVVALLALEWARMTGMAAPLAVALLAAAAGLPAIVAHFAGLLAALAAVALGMAALALLASKRLAVNGWASLAVAWFGLPAVCLIWLRQAGEHAPTGLVYVLLVVWAADSGAYLVGRWLGGPKLAPRISPGKTCSGAAGGLVATILAGGGLAAVTGLASVPALAGLSLLLAAAAEIGDLAESAAKRRWGVKDSGRLIPGHGGIFDRVDALLFVLPLAAAAAVLNGGELLPWR